MKLKTMTKLNINVGTNNPYHAIIKCVWWGLSSHFSRLSLQRLPHSPLFSWLTALLTQITKNLIT